MLRFLFTEPKSSKQFIDCCTGGRTAGPELFAVVMGVEDKMWMRDGGLMGCEM